LFRMLWSSYYFFILYANIDHFIPKNQDLTPTNILDKWIISKIEKLNIDLEKSMNSYDLVISARAFQPFIDDLSNWYIRRSRKRFWKSENDNDKNSAYETLYYVLVKLSLLMAPFTPFISEEIYKNLTGKDSVHLQDFPEAKKELINEKLIISMDKARKYVEIGLAKRAEAKIRVRQPLSEVKYKGEKLSPELESIIADELNVKKIIQASVIKDEIELNTSISPELEIEGCARELVRTVQSLRKKADFNISDRIELFYDTDSDTLLKAFSNHEVYIKNETLSDAITNSRADVEHSQEEKIAGENIWFGARRKKT